MDKENLPRILDQGLFLIDEKFFRKNVKSIFDPKKSKIEKIFYGPENHIAIMSLTGITAFIKKNASSLAGKEEYLRSVMSMLSVLVAPTEEEEVAPKKSTSKSSTKSNTKSSAKTTSKSSGSEGVVYLVTGWCDSGDVALVGDEDAVRKVADDLAAEKLNLAKTTAADLKKELKDTGYFGIKVPSKRAQLTAGVIAHAKKHKIPQVKTLEDLPERDAEPKKGKTKTPAKPPAKPAKGKKAAAEEPEEDAEFDESEEAAEEDEDDEEEEAEEEEAAEEEVVSEEEEEKPKSKGKKKSKNVDSDDE